MASTTGPRIVITYCTQCRWLLRAGWVAQELLTSFTVEIGEVALRPGVGGVFRVTVDDELVWDRTTDGGFPEIGQLKRLVRDRIAPGRDLGHTDRAQGDRAQGHRTQPEPTSADPAPTDPASTDPAPTDPDPSPA